MQVMLASGNQGKLRELQSAFDDLGIQLIPQPKEPAYEVEETGTTFVENAIIKARHTSQLSGLPAIADDSGLIVPALNGAPGVRSARYAGEQAQSSDNNQKLLEAMTNISDRGAHFFCCLVMLRHHLDPDPVIATGQWQGEIAQSLSGHEGFGYDPLFYVPDQACTAAKLAPETKQKLSHRGQAVKALKALIQSC